MGISLTKGGNFSFEKEAPGLSRVKIGLGWDAEMKDGTAPFDIDASAILLNESNKVTCNEDFVYFGNLSAGGVTHLGDNLTGEGDGDDEQITVVLGDIAEGISKVVFTTTLFEAAARKQNFGQIENAYVRVMNADTDEEIARYDLDEDFSMEASVMVGEIYRNPSNPGDWKFKALAQGYEGSIRDIALDHGVEVD